MYDNNSSEYLTKREFYLAYKLSKTHMEELADLSRGRNGAGDNNESILNVYQKYGESLQKLSEKTRKYISIGGHRDVESDFMLNDRLYSSIDEIDTWLREHYAIKSERDPTPSERESFYKTLDVIGNVPTIGKNIAEKWAVSVPETPLDERPEEQKIFAMIEHSSTSPLRDDNGEIVKDEDGNILNSHSIGKKNLISLYKLAKRSTLIDKHESIIYDNRFIRNPPAFDYLVGKYKEFINDINDSIVNDESIFDLELTPEFAEKNKIPSDYYLVNKNNSSQRPLFRTHTYAQNVENLETAIRESEERRRQLDRGVQNTRTIGTQTENTTTPGELGPSTSYKRTMSALGGEAGPSNSGTADQDTKRQRRDREDVFGL